MLDKIQNSFRDLVSCLQVGRLYPLWHPQFKKYADKAYLSLLDSLKERQELVIGIIGEELAFEKEIFFELSKTVKPMILYLKERGIEKITFYQGLQREELEKFVSFLVNPQEEAGLVIEEALVAEGVNNIILGRIKPLAEEKKQAAGSDLDLYESSLIKLNNSVDAILNDQEIDRLTLRFTVNDIIRNLLGRYQEFLNFSTVKRYDLKTFSHIINVSLLAMYFSSKLGFAKDQVHDIGVSAVFHDIGKLYISRKIIQKQGKLTEEEFESIKNHVIAGAQILLKYVDTLGILPVVVCFEHHLKYDLTGYPKLSFSQKPHVASLIVSICDVYDALCQRRSYKADYPPEEIYEIMKKDEGKAFEPELLGKFFSIFGVWPVGTLVALSDGKVAVVREENEADIFSPKVEIIGPADQKERLDLKEAKGRVKIMRSLNPLREGKEYLEKI